MEQHQLNQIAPIPIAAAAAITTMSIPPLASTQQTSDLARNKEITKTVMKNAQKLKSLNFKWTSRSYRFLLAEVSLACWNQSIHKPGEVFDAFCAAVTKDGGAPPQTQSVFSTKHKEMARYCMMYYQLRSNAKHVVQTTTQRFDMHAQLSPNQTKELEECIAYFKGSTPKEPITSKELDMYAIYGMRIAESNYSVEKFNSAAAKKKKRLDKQAAEGLQSATGSITTHKKQRRTVLRSYNEDEDAEDGNEDGDYNDDAAAVSEESVRRTDEGNNEAEFEYDASPITAGRQKFKYSTDSDEEEEEDSYLRFSSGSSSSSRKRPDRKIFSITNTAQQFNEISNSVRIRNETIERNTQLTREMELAKLELDEKKHLAAVDAAAKQHEGMMAMIELQRKAFEDAQRNQQQFNSILLQFLQNKKE